MGPPNHRGWRQASAFPREEGYLQEDYMNVPSEVERGIMDIGPSKNPSLSEQAPSNLPSMCPHQVSKAARQEKRFQDYNERCTFHHQARVSSGQRVDHQRAG